MQRLRTILNSALANQALRVRLVTGQEPEWLLANQSTQRDGQGLLTDSDLQGIFATVLPGQTFSSAGVMTGALNVGTHGVLKLRARRDPVLSLDIYTPMGTDLYESDVAVPLPVVPPPPLASAIPQESPSLSVSSREPVTLDAPASPVPQPVQVKASDSADASAKVGDGSEDLMQMFRVVSVAKKNPGAKPSSGAEDKVEPKATLPLVQEMPVVREPAPVQSKPDTHSVTPASHHAPVPTAEPVPTIDFGAKEASEGSISQGKNPIDDLLREMVNIKASDMHLTVGQPVIFRVHGDISRTGAEFITPAMMERLLLPTIPPRNAAEFSKVSDTDFAYELVGVGRFRVNIFRDRNGVGAVLRHIPSQILTAEQLKLPAAITKLCTLNKGLVLVTGPTGSGKSTTLAAMLDLINKTRKEHILTIEDPIEFVHPQQQCLVNQREVHKHTGSFARALKAALREDPDVVLIGEMRDLETIAIAIETAETGHLVFGTLHTTTAMSTVDRIIDQFPADRQAQIRTMLASSLRGVVAQTLLKKKGGGRVAAHEILISNDAVSAMIREGKIQHLANHMMTQKQDGNQLLNDSLLKLVQDGLVDPEEAFFKSVDKNSFLSAAKQRGIVIAA